MLQGNPMWGSSRSSESLQESADINDSSYSVADPPLVALRSDDFTNNGWVNHLNETETIIPSCDSFNEFFVLHSVNNHKASPDQNFRHGLPTKSTVDNLQAHCKDSTTFCVDGRSSESISLPSRNVQKTPNRSSPLNQSTLSISSASFKRCPFANCSYWTRNAKLMNWHKRSHQKASYYYCKVCRFKFGQRRALLKHLTQKHESNSDLIGIFFTEPEAADSNFDDDEDNAANSVFAQNIEKTVQKVVDDSKEHSKTQAASTYSCGNCDFEANNFMDFYKHKQAARCQSTRKDPNAYDRTSPANVCLYCFKKFASSNNLLAHIKKQHLNNVQKSAALKPKYPCKKCAFITTSKKLLKAHEDYARHSLRQGEEFSLYKTEFGFGNMFSRYDSNTVNGQQQDYGRDSGYHELIIPQHYSTKGKVLNGGSTSSWGSPTTKESRLFFHHSSSDGSTVTCFPTIGQLLMAGTSQVARDCGTTTNLNTSDSNPNCQDDQQTPLGRMVACVEHVQASNSHLMALCADGDRRLQCLRANVLELLKRVYSTQKCLDISHRGPSALHEVDALVIEAINSGFRT